MTVGERIQYRRKQLGMSVDELAKAAGKSRATMYRYESGDIESLPLVVLEPIIKALNTTAAYLMGWTDDPHDTGIPDNSIPSYDGLEPISTRTLPIYDGIAAGEPRFMDEEVEYYASVSDTIRADFAIRVHGDSMTGARINDGDLVFIKKQKEVENGTIAAVGIDDEATLKRFYKYGDIIVLRSENPAYKEMTFTEADGKSIYILGKAVAFQSNIE